MIMPDDQLQKKLKAAVIRAAAKIANDDMLGRRLAHYVWDTLPKSDKLEMVDIIYQEVRRELYGARTLNKNRAYRVRRSKLKSL